MGGGPDYLGRDRAPQGPEYLDRKTGVDWRKHEADIEKRSGDRRRAASGATPGKPADNKGQKWLREAKATKGAGITIKALWLRKIVEEAMALGLDPLLEIRVDGAEAPVPTDWVLVPSIDFETLRERAGDC